MHFSVAETIKYLVGEVHKIKEDDPICPVTIIAPNLSLRHSINRFLLKSGQPLLNVRIETFFQFIKRHAEPVLLNRGIPFITMEHAHLLVQNILRDNALEYFRTARDFPSYAPYFLHTVNELRVSVPENCLYDALGSLGVKGKELSEIKNGYLQAKKSMADYADMLGLWPGSDETLILFPGVESDLSLIEINVLARSKSVRKIPKQHSRVPPFMELCNPLSSSQEAKEVFRKLLVLGVPFDKAAIIAPVDYLAQVQEEAHHLNIPVFCPNGEDMILDQIEIFRAALEVLRSDYAYQDLKRFFQLENQFSPISALLECGVAAGGDLIRKKAEELKHQKNRNRLQKLTVVLDHFKEIEALRDRPHEMGKAVVAHFLKKSRQTQILKGILTELSEFVPDVDYETWERLLNERMNRIKATSDHRENAVFLTTDFMPGAFDYIFLLGIKEGSFPGRFREDPLLLDYEREKINAETGGDLRTAGQKNKKLTESLDLTVACAGKGWLGSFPSMDLNSGDEEFPSFHLVNMVRQIDGKGTLTINDYHKKLRSVRVPWTIKQADQCLDPLEWTLHHLMNDTEGFIGHMIGVHISPQRHLRAYRAYWDDHFNEYTGFVQSVSHEGPQEPPRFSATQLEVFMTCPYRWFIERRLGVRALEEPETLEKPDAMTMGTIVHKVLEKYMRETKNPSQDKNTLDRILNEEIERHAASTGDIAPIYLEKVRKDLGRLTDSFLRHSEKYLKDGREPDSFELAFGTSHKENYQEDPVTLNIGKHKILLSGSIDRIDIKERTAVILDYKNSNANKYGDVAFMKGRRLQPALYSEAFMALKGDNLGIEEVFAGYLPLRDNAKEYVVLYDKTRKEILSKIIDFIMGAIDIGYFFPTGNCDWCDYGRICGKGIVLSSSRKLENAVSNGLTKALAVAFKSFEEL